MSVKMSLKKDFSKPMSPIIRKQSANTNLATFNFKQLEDDVDGDLLVYSGKYEKIIEDSQKTQKKSRERASSTSSVSSTLSNPGEIMHPLKTNLEGMIENFKLSLKPTTLFPTETTSSSIKIAALAKLETSKDLFSGLKGKITDKISRTIEEFSGDSSSNSSPEKEKAKHVPLQNSNRIAENEIDSAFQTASNADNVLTPDENVQLQNKSCLLNAHPKSPLSVLKSASPPVKDHPLISSKKNEILFHDKTVSKLISSDFIETHPLAKSDVGSDFEIINPQQNELLSGNMKVVGNSSEHSLHCTEINASNFMSGNGSEPEAARGNNGLLTDDKLNSSKIKQFPMNKNVSETTVPNLHSYHIEHCAFSLKEQSEAVSKTQEHHVSQQHDEVPVKDKTNSVSSKSTKYLILKQLSLEDCVLPHQKLIAVVILLFTYLIVPLPSYLSGFIMGTLLASLIWALYIWLIEKPRLPEPGILPKLFEPHVPEMKVTVKGEEYLYKGWMNELKEYNADDYHINKTQSVFVSLEGSHLRIQKSKNATPKRAMWDEVLPKPHFIHQRHFDLPGSKVFLLPHRLVKKRLWSKKYPICVILTDKNSSDAKLRHTSSDPVMVEKKTKMPEMGNEFVVEEKFGHNVLYLFARTGRDKEEWFKRLVAAASNKPLANHVMEMKRVLSQSSTSVKKNVESMQKHKRQGSTSSLHSFSLESPSEPPSQKLESLDLLTFANYMGRLMPSGSLPGASSPIHNTTSKDIGKNSHGKETNKNSHDKDLNETKLLSPGSSIICESQMFWINALIGRCFFDFLRDKWLISKVQEKLQRKLSKIHVPYFIEELQVTGINMGCEVPGIRHAGKPYMDERGFWVDLDIAYAGGFQMTIETKINLLKLKNTPHVTTHSVHNLKSPVTNSDEEDSAESSTDEDEEAPNTEENSLGGGTSKKLLHYLNKITQSKYFQQATEYKVIKRAMENVSNTPLTLTVTVISLVGKLAVNIPPPPSDRLWYGFRGNPHVRLSAKPQVGERAVTITHVVEWIEKKLATEFQRVFVMPNMDDLIIPILVPGEMYDATTTSSAVSVTMT